MTMVDVSALGRLVAEYEALSALRSPEARQRLRDVCYTIGVYTGETDAVRAVARARTLLDLQAPVAPVGSTADAPAVDRARTALLAELGALAARERALSGPPATLTDVLRLAQVALPSCVGVAVSTWRDAGSVETLASSSPQLLVLERAQGEEGGPLSRIRRQAEGLVVVRLDSGPPGRFADRTRRCGVRTVVTAHLRTLPHGCTAFSAYLRDPAEPGVTVLGLVKVLALQASAALDRLALARTVADLLDRRHATGLAIGMTMERFGVTPHAALELLAGVAQRSGTDLDTVAGRLAGGEMSLPAAEDRPAPHVLTSVDAAGHAAARVPAPTVRGSGTRRCAVTMPGPVGGHGRPAVVVVHATDAVGPRGGLVWESADGALRVEITGDVATVLSAPAGGALHPCLHAVRLP
ncbi:DUF6296 family protein [Kitasatospora sp. NPDC093550]|uniref:DUF6296 family protein n=1 Tax=Kitasatospora sp. NPDC093550 TaxID=3364089 RepID=UPI0037FF2051